MCTLLLLFALPFGFSVTDDAIAAWSFDDADMSGTSPLDDSGNNHNLTVSGTISSTTGITNEGRDFSGAGNYYQRTGGDHSDFDITGDITISVWAKSSDWSTQQGLVTKYDGTTVAYILQTLSNQIRFGGAVAGVTSISGTGWKHIVGTKCSGTITVWVDGYSGTNASEPTFSTNNAPIEIGARNGGATNFNGQLDNVLIYNRCLSSAERAELYNAGAGYWPYSTAPPATPFWDVTVKDKDNASTLTQVQVVLQNGTVYNNATSGTVQTNINDSSLQTFVVSSTNYWGQNRTNYNTSFDLVANLTQYPFVAAWDGNDFSNASINFNATISSSTYTSSGGYKLVPYNNSQTVQYTFTYYLPKNISHDFTGATDLNTSFVSSEIKFNATAIITNASVPGVSFTINGLTKSTNSPFYLYPGDYNVTASAPGYYDKTQQITVALGDNQTYTITDMGGAIINVTPKEYITGATINAFTVTIENAEYSYFRTYSSSLGWQSVPIIGGVAFTVNVSATNYTSNVTTINTTFTEYNHSPILAKVNKVSIYFFDEQTLNQITDVNWTLASQTYQGYGLSGQNTTPVLSEIPSGTYDFRYTKPGYTERSYFFSIPFDELVDANISVYLLNETESTSFVLTVTDKFNNPVEGLFASLLRRYVVGGVTQYYVVEMMQPSVALGGSTPFTAEPTTVPYLFRVANEEGTVLFQGAATTADNFETLYLIDSEYFIQVNPTTSAFDTLSFINGYAYSLTRNAAGFHYSFSDPGDQTTRNCLRVYMNGTETSNSCSTQSSGVISQSVTFLNGTLYAAQAYIDYDGKRYTLDNIIYDLRDTEVSTIFGVFGLFILLVNLIFIAVGLSSHPAVAIIASTFAIVAYGAGFLGIVAISLSAQVFVIVISIILAVVVSR